VERCGVRPARQDAPDVVSCLHRKVQTPANIWRDAEQKSPKRLITASEFLWSHVLPFFPLDFPRFLDIVTYFVQEVSWFYDHKVKKRLAL